MIITEKSEKETRKGSNKRINFSFMRFFIVKFSYQNLTVRWKSIMKTILIVVPSFSGKTSFVLRKLEECF